jgi:hypothetical protein
MANAAARRIAAARFSCRIESAVMRGSGASSGRRNRHPRSRARARYRGQPRDPRRLGQGPRPRARAGGHCWSGRGWWAQVRHCARSVRCCWRFPAQRRCRSGHRHAPAAVRPGAGAGAAGAGAATAAAGALSGAISSGATDALAISVSVMAASATAANRGTGLGCCGASSSGEKAARVIPAMTSSADMLRGRAATAGQQAHPAGAEVAVRRWWLSQARARRRAQA